MTKSGSATVGSLWRLVTRTRALSAARVAGTALFISACPAMALATPLNYSIDVTQTLDAQLWGLTGGAATYDNLGGTLNYTSMGAGADYGYYGRAVPDYDPTSPWRLTWVARVDDDELVFDPPAYWAGAYTTVGLGGYGLSIGFDRDDLTIFDGDGWVNSTIVFSEGFRTFVATGNPLTGAYTVTVDGVPVGSGTMYGAGDGFVIGDATIQNNASVSTQSWQVTQLGVDDPTPVPEPATGALVLLGGASLLFGALRKNRR